MISSGTNFHRRTFVQALGAGLAASTALHATGFASLAQRSRTDEEDAGLLGPGEYESPDYGYAITWDETWDTSPNGDGISAEVREEDAGFVNVLPLGLVESGLSWTAIFTGYTIEAELADTPELVGKAFVALYEDLDPADLGWTDYQVLASDFDDESGAIITYQMDHDRPMMSLHEVRLLDDSTALIRRLLAPPTAFLETYESAQDAISLDRDAPFALLRDRDIEQAVEDGIARLDQGQSKDPDEDDEPADTTKTNRDIEDTYLADVRDHYNELDASMHQFVELVNGNAITDADVDEIETIVRLWEAAPDAAAAIDAPASLSEIEDAHLAYAGALGDTAAAFGAFLDTEEGSADADQAIVDFQNALDDAATLGTTLDDLLTDAGV